MAKKSSAKTIGAGLAAAVVGAGIGAAAVALKSKKNRKAVEKKVGELKEKSGEALATLRTKATSFAKKTHGIAGEKDRENSTVKRVRKSAKQKSTKTANKS